MAGPQTRGVEPVYVFTRNMIVAFVKLFFRWSLGGLEQVPARGPAIIAANHISYFDPLCHAFFVDRAGRRPRFFAKSELWKNPVLRFILRGCGQIPVHRGTGETGPVEKALEALHRGEVVVIYPESTITSSPDLTPMQGKTGIARVAIASGAPVVPVAVWGSHWVKPKGRKAVQRWRRLIVLQAGEPLTFAGLRGREDDAAVRREVTDRVVGELDRLVRDLHKVYPDGAAVPDLREQ